MVVLNMKCTYSETLDDINKAIQVNSQISSLTYCIDSVTGLELGLTLFNEIAESSLYNDKAVNENNL